jgi:hypothetical protein
MDMHTNQNRLPGGRTLTVLVCWLLITAGALVSIAAASPAPVLQATPVPPMPPATYYGLILEGYGFTPTVGMTVTAWIGGHLCGQATTRQVGEDIGYSIDVQADWDAAPGCGAEGRIVNFYVTTHLMKPKVVWNNSQLHAYENLQNDPTAIGLRSLHAAANGDRRWAGVLIGVGLCFASAGAWLAFRRRA